MNVTQSSTKLLRLYLKALKSITKCVSILIINHHVLFFLISWDPRSFLTFLQAGAHVQKHSFHLKVPWNSGNNTQCVRSTTTDGTLNIETCTHLFQTGANFGYEHKLVFRSTDEMWNHRKDDDRIFFLTTFSFVKREKKFQWTDKNCQFKETFKHWPWMIP